MRIALTGATGFIGSAIARHLHERGHLVTALVRESSNRAHVEPFVDRFVVGDHADHTAWPALLEGAEGIVHNSLDVRSFRDDDMQTHLRSNLVGSIEFLLATAPARFVFISTMAVHHDMRPRWEGVIDEDHPLRPNHMYGAYKAAVEAHLWAKHYDSNRHTVAIRPCAVYGPDPTGNHLHTMPVFEAVKKGAPYLRQGGGKFIHVDDVARATVAAVERDDASGEAFNLVDCYARYADLARFASEATGTSIEVDESSPAQPENEFDMTNARRLVPDHAEFLNRGHAGLRAHFRDLFDTDA